MVPKARGMSDLLEVYEGPLTADFQRVYGLRLIQTVVTHELDELLSLITWLPSGCAYHATLESEGDLERARSLLGWTPLQDLTLGLANLVSHQTYVISQTNSSKRLKPPTPVPGPRGTKPTTQTTRSATGIARAFLEAQKGG